MVLGGEHPIQAKLLTPLVAQGYELLRVADTASREAGTDIVAWRDDRRLHVEVKGWPSQLYRDPAKAHLIKPTSAATQARVWFNDAVVHALRLRDAHPDDDLAMALPDRMTYRNLVSGISGSLARSAVSVLLVDQHGTVTSAEAAS